MKTYAFVVHDDHLRQAICRSILKYLPKHEVAFCRRGDIVRARLTIFCVSNLPTRIDLLAIEDSHLNDRRVVLLANTEDREKWRELARLHDRSPFLLVIAVGGPREKFKQYFPRAKIISDITRLEEPGEQIASILADVASQQPDLPSLDDHTGPIPRPYASIE